MKVVFPVNQWLASIIYVCNYLLKIHWNRERGEVNVFIAAVEKLYTEIISDFFISDSQYAQWSLCNHVINKLLILNLWKSFCLLFSQKSNLILHYLIPLSKIRALLLYLCRLFTYCSQLLLHQFNFFLQFCTISLDQSLISLYLAPLLLQPFFPLLHSAFLSCILCISLLFPLHSSSDGLSRHYLTALTCQLLKQLFYSSFYLIFMRWLDRSLTGLQVLYQLNLIQFLFPVALELMFLVFHTLPLRLDLSHNYTFVKKLLIVFFVLLVFIIRWIYWLGWRFASSNLGVVSELRVGEAVDTSWV